MSYIQVQWLSAERTDALPLYGPDQERWCSAQYRDGNLVRSTIYAGDYEEVYENGDTRGYYYLDGNVIVIRDGLFKPYLAFTDNIGSMLSVFDEEGRKVFDASYDAWGKQTITQNDIGLYRGYTGHEMLNEYDIINMNGRLYDPVIGRFFSPDNYVQMPDNSQNFNRYSYCLNNPSKYTDPSGEWFGIDDLIAAVAGGVINLAVNAIQGNVTSWGSALGYFGVGAVSGWASLYVGPFAVGAISGLGNYITTQVSQGGWSSLNFDDGVTATAIGAATSWAGAKIGGWATKNLGGIFSSISSPVLRQAAVNSVGGAVSGFAIGTAVSYIQYKDFDRAFSEGVRGGLMGAGIGLTTGAIGGYRYAKENKLSPWTGRNLNNETLYQISDGIKRAKVADMLGMKTIRAEDSSTNSTFDVPIKNLRITLKDQINLTRQSEINSYRSLFKLVNDNKYIPIFISPINQDIGIKVKDFKVNIKLSL